MAIKLDLPEYMSGGCFYNLSHHDLSNYKINYYDAERVYNLQLDIYRNEKDHLPLISINGRAVHDLIEAILFNLDRRHMEAIANYVIDKLEDLKDKPWKKGRWYLEEFDV